MTKTLETIGTSKGLLLTEDMLQHLGVADEVELTFEAGQIVLTAPHSGVPAPGRRKSFEEAKNATFAQYDTAMQRLANVDE